MKPRFPSIQTKPSRHIQLVSLLALAGLNAPAMAETLPLMVDIPAGEWTTDACPGVPNGRVCPPETYLRQTIQIAPFQLSATAVTFAQWDACVDDGGCQEADTGWAYQTRPNQPPCQADAPCNYPYDEGWGRGDRPVIHVSWNDAQRYVDWLSQKTGRRYRLPTSEEWEYAAAAGSPARFSWGAKLGKNRANCDGCGSRWDGKQTAPVASFAANRFGLYDMVGNVSEWVSTCVPIRSKRGEDNQTCMAYLYRGGAWSYDAKAVGIDTYNSTDADFRASYIGFRVAR
ncbi:formylglycine-generating enzyme family protein [Chromobacterium vaccinii]|uniref:formylglycine-generating enzyme family protein n=1 Tax=Chromobacterium vaccinii TaxID=1108595 RepID=UPI000E115ED6|nr:SUMF1/EgtB/PvdO family nonheme iron enzyme [Chromobacterium vaccinii]SUX29729.1 Serine/threonine-protein kinase pkn1 [Chromobacterium vaccinii]